jgi:hypothetical protein
VSILTAVLGGPTLVLTNDEWEELKRVALKELPRRKHVNLALESAYADLRAEHEFMRRKHGEKSIDGNEIDDFGRLAAAVEEFGEVGECLTYDKDRVNLRHELLQLANVAVTWASTLLCLFRLRS